MLFSGYGGGFGFYYKRIYNKTKVSLSRFRYFSQPIFIMLLGRKMTTFSGPAGLSGRT